VGEIPRRVALVVHPSRPLETALESVAEWASRHGVGVVQLPMDGIERRVAPPGAVEPGDLVVALGGDGTALSALRAAMPAGAPVLAVACGSVGALSAVTGDELEDALEQLRAGDWTSCDVPALAVQIADAPVELALNDFVLVRRGAGQIVAEVAVDGQLYVQLAGDGLIVATPLGSSAYTMAAGGPLLTRRSTDFVCTPLAMHGGSAAPLVVPADAVLTIEVHAHFAGFDVELDGHRRAGDDRSFRVTLHENKGRLVTFTASDTGLERLRERGLIADSPRALARAARRLTR
jgi:NAD+ kinase